MRIFRTEVWSYAVLLIILFCIASVAVWYTLQFIEEHVSPAEFSPIAAALWSLTMGFMLIAGSFGLWAIKFAGEAEGRRRVGRLVDTMDYLSDGLIVADEKGRISGSNPAARAMSGHELNEKERLAAVFPCLDESDVSLLLRSDMPNEVEREVSLQDGLKTWRFRSQPAEGVVMLLISDVTRNNIQRLRSRHAARLQLIGEIAKGVAHDFNNLLCGISGYASLLTRIDPGSRDAGDCVKAITQSVERGIAMAGHLLTLSQDGSVGRFTEMVSDHIESAGAMLRDSLSDGWRVETRAHGNIPPVALTGAQVEQIVTNLGFLCADQADKPSVLRIEAGGGDQPGILKAENMLAGVLIVGVVPPGVSLNNFRNEGAQGVEYGVIESVLKSMLQESGGNLQVLVDDGGNRMFRVSLPMGNFTANLHKGGELPEELKAYLSGWTVLFASVRKEYANVYERMQELDLSVTRCDSIAALLAAIENAETIDAMVIDGRILGAECKGILRAVLKLRPHSAIIVLSENPNAMPRELSTDVLFLDSADSPDSVVAAMIEAKTLASHRK